MMSKKCEKRIDGIRARLCAAPAWSVSSIFLQQEGVDMSLRGL
jgi:hypothetical protein